MPNYRCLITIVFLFIKISIFAQVLIPPNFYGINAWMVKDVGSSHRDGRFKEILEQTNLVQNLNPAFFRFGGTTYDKNLATISQLTEFVELSKKTGAEPIIQIPFLFQLIRARQIDQGATVEAIAQGLVPGASNNYVETIVNSMKALGVRFFSIGNEPDRYKDESDGVLTAELNADEIEDYLRIISGIIRTNHPSAIIIGPSLAGPKVDHNGDLAFSLLDNDNSLTYIGNDIDILSFNVYPFPLCVWDQSSNQCNFLRSRDAIIDQPTTQISSQPNSHLLGQLIALKELIAQSDHPNIQIAITEFNVNSINEGNNGFSDISARSFLAGQWMAEMFMVGLLPETLSGFGSNTKPFASFMLPWSIHEGSPRGGGDQFDLGILDGDISTTSNTLKRRPTYNHMQLLSNNFTGVKSIATTTGTSKIKAYASKSEDRIAVLIMNQNNSGTSTFKISLDGTSSSTQTDFTAIFPDLNIDIEYLGNDNTDNKHKPIENQSTVMLIFDCNGNISGRWDYKLSDIISSSADVPPVFTSIDDLVVGYEVSMSSTVSNNVATVTLSPTTGFGYSWSGPNGFSSTDNPVTLPACTASVVCGFTFTTVNLSTGCFDIQTVRLTESGLVTSLAPTASVTSVNGNCAGGYSNGSAQLVNPQNYNSIEWSNGVLNQTSISNLSPGEYYVTLIGATGSTGEPMKTTYHFVINPDFHTGSVKTFKAITGNAGISGELVVERGAYLNISAANVQCVNGSKVIVKDGGALIIGNAVLSPSTCGGTWQGIDIQPGGFAYFQNGTHLKLNGIGKIIVGGGNNLPAHLSYEPNVTIELSSISNVFEIAGELFLRDNTIFKTVGSGYVKFSMPTNAASGTYNLLAGNNVSMLFEGNSNNQLKLQVTQDELFIPATVSNFLISNCKVSFSSNSALSILGANTSSTIINSKIGGGNGIKLFGQANTVINNNMFEGGQYGIYAYLSPGGHPLKISNCSFNNYSVCGVFVHDKAIRLTDCAFNDNVEGIKSDLMTLPSSIHSSTINSSFYLGNLRTKGISYLGGYTAPLSVTSSSINENGDGILVSGASAKIKCSTVKNNEFTGIHISSNATLNMGSATGVGGGFVDAGDNGLTIYSDDARFINLNNGYNNLLSDYQFSCFPNFVAGCRPRNIEGNLTYLYDPCNDYLGSEIHIPAHGNRWNPFFQQTPGGPVSDNSSTGISPLDGYEFDLNTSYEYYIPSVAPGGGSYYRGNIILDDVTPHSLGSCLSPIPDANSPLDPVLYCPTCPFINSEDFQGVRLNQAVKTAIDKMADSLQLNTAIEYFKQILKTTYSVVNNNERYLLDLSYQKMMEALGEQAYRFAAAYSQIQPNVDAVIEVQNYMLSRPDCQINYYQRFYTLIDKAEVYIMNNQKEIAINVLNQAKAIASTSDIGFINELICKTNLDLAVERGDIKKEDYQKVAASCSGNYSSQKIKNSYYQSFQTADKNYSTDLRIHPNPSTGILKILVDAGENGRVTDVFVYNFLGSCVYNTKVLSQIEKDLDLSFLTAGVYNIMAKSSSSIIGSEKVIIIK